MSHGDQDFSEDLFEHTKMSFWDHIEELRTHMWRAIAGFMIGLILGFFIGKPMERVIAAPVEKALTRYYDERIKTAETEMDESERVEMSKPQEMTLSLAPKESKKLLDAWNVKTSEEPRNTDPIDVTFQFNPLKVSQTIAKPTKFFVRPPTLATMSATEAFIVYLKVSMYCGLVISSPWVFYQLWSFIAAGLYPHEKRLVHVYMPVSILLFWLGVALCEFVVLPITLDYLLSFNAWMNLEPDLRLNEWLSFALLFPLVFGIAFQLPLVMFALHRIGIVDVEFYRSHRRIAYFLIACSYIIVGVSPDWFSMLAMVIPLFALYELGIFFCRFSPKPLLDFGGPEEEEMVEA